VSYPTVTLLGRRLHGFYTGQAMPKPTTRFVEKITPNPTRRLEIPDSLLPGLYLIVQPSGAKSWAVRYRHSGRTRKYTLDSVARLVLGEARDRAREALKAVSAGRDPAFDRQEAKSGGSDLVRDVVADFLELHVRANNRPRTAEEAARTFKLHVLPKWANRRVQDIARRENRSVSFRDTRKSTWPLRSEGRAL
jgi:Arm DNA-binding domain